jgi:hypothetical protein
MRGAGGVFRSTSPALRAQRDAVLATSRWLEPPALATAIQFTRVLDAPAYAAAQLDAIGLATVRFAQVLSSLELLRFAGCFGEPMPEASPHASAHAEQDAVLNLVPTEAGEVVSTDGEPFSMRPIRMHSEASRAPPDAQPTHLVFQCVRPAGDGCGGQTLIRAMSDVAARLDDGARTALEHTRYAGAAGTGAILTGARFAFRDFGSDELAWIYDGAPRADAAGEVNAAFEALTHALYDPPIFGLPAAPALVVVLDNRRWFHGRTAIRAGGGGRHLQRVRVIAGDAGRSAARDACRS